MQGYMHFDGEKLLVAKNREQERLNRPTGGLKMWNAEWGWQFSRGFNSPNHPVNSHPVRNHLPINAVQ